MYLSQCVFILIQQGSQLEVIFTHGSVIHMAISKSYSPRGKWQIPYEKHTTAILVSNIYFFKVVYANVKLGQGNFYIFTSISLAVRASLIWGCEKSRMHSGKS